MEELLRNLVDVISGEVSVWKLDNQDSYPRIQAWNHTVMELTGLTRDQVKEIVYHARKDFPQRSLTLGDIENYSKEFGYANASEDR